MTQATGTHERENWRFLHLAFTSPSIASRVSKIAIICQRLIALDAEKLVERRSSWKPLDKMLFSAAAKLATALFSTNVRMYVSLLSRTMRVTIRGTMYPLIYKLEERNFLLAARLQSIRQCILGISARSQAFARRVSRVFPAAFHCSSTPERKVLNPMEAFPEMRASEVNHVNHRPKSTMNL